MIKKLFDKFNKKLKERKGASLVIVLVSLSMLIVLGTVFSTLSYQSYKNSYGNLCRQQAKYTAKSVLDGVITKFQSEGAEGANFRKKVGNAILTSLGSKKPGSEDINFGEIEIDINGLHDYVPNNNPTLAGSISAVSNKKDCKLFASYIDSSKTKVRLTVSAIYRGFNSSISAVLGITNQAALELSKIMSNTLYITSPIADMMYFASAFDDYQIDGDVYIDRPLKIDDEDPYKNIEAMANDGSNQIASGGHTLGIDIEGRPLVLEDNNITGEDLLKYLKNSGLFINNPASLTSKDFPKPRLDANNKITFIYDANGNTYPVKDSNGNYSDVHYSAVRYVYDSKKNKIAYDTIYTNKEGNTSLNPQLTDKDERAWLYERDENGNYLLEKELMFIDEGTKKPIYKYASDGSFQNYRKLIDGQDPSGDYKPDTVYTYYIYCWAARKLDKSEKNAVYKVYDCEYMVPELNQDGTVKKDGHGTIIYQIKNSSSMGLSANQEITYYGKVYVAKKNPENSEITGFELKTLPIFKLHDVDGKCYQQFYDEKGYPAKDLPVYETERKMILGEKMYQNDPPKGYEKDKWYANTDYGYGMEVESIEWLDRDDRKAIWDEKYCFKFKDKRIENGTIKPNEIFDKYENGKLVTDYERYPIQRFQRKRAKTLMQDIPLPMYRTESKPNEWTEVYLRSHYKSGVDLSGSNVPIVINGKLKCNTDVLLGLYNRGVDGNGSDHEFIRDVGGQKRVVPVAFDTQNDKYTIPKYTCLRTSDDIYVNGNVRAENLMCGGTLYAVDLEDKDDGTREGCKGNVVLEQMCPVKKVIGLPVSLTTYMEVAKNNDDNSSVDGYKKVDGIVADGFVVVVGGVANISEKAKIHGDIRAGRYTSAGKKWGFNGRSIEDIPKNRYYREDGSKPAADDLPDSISGGIYGYNTQICEERWNKKNRYELGSGDVVLQKTIVYGNIYATGDVYINNGTIIYGDIYTPGNVYVTKGESPAVGIIGNMFDGRSRVLGSIYAGGTVAITGGSEVGKWDAKKGEPYYDSGVYCNDLYIRGRISTGKNHDAVTGNVFCKNNCTVLGRYTPFGAFNTRLGFHGGNIFVGGKFGGTKDKPLQNVLLKGGGKYYFKGGEQYLEFPLWRHFTNQKEVDTTLKMDVIPNIQISAKLLNIEKRKTITRDLSAKVRKWSAPDKTSLNIDESKFYKDDVKDTPQEGVDATGDDTIIGVGGSSTYQEKTVVNGINHFIVRHNLKSISKIVLKDNDVLTLDTSKQNLHICVSGNIEVGKNATIRIHGPNMANLYLNNNHNQKIVFDENCFVGEVVGVPVGVSEKYAGLNIISHKNIDMIIKQNAKVITYNYIPKGALFFELPTLNTRTEVRPQGSFVVNRIIGGNLENMRYWAIKFATKKSPLIVDKDNNFGNPDDQSSDGNDFKDIVWEVINYE